MTRTSRRLTVGLLCVAMSVAVAVAVFYARYREYPWSAYPPTLWMCGRDFQPGEGPETRVDIGRSGYHLTRHGSANGIFGGSPVWAVDAVDGERASRLPGGCSVVMWVQDGADSYRDYELEGGP